MTTPLTPSGSDSSRFVVEITADNFQREVVERSYEVPVVIDFWAEWCGPCRALGPVLEGLAEEFGGKFVLAKIDTEAVPEIAAGFGVRSIPAVYALREGQPVDAFVGALPEPEVRAWLNRIMPSPAESLAIEARGLEATDLPGATARYRESLTLEPAAPTAQLGLARVLVRQGQFDEARGLIQGLEAHGYFDAEVEAVKAELELKLQAEDAGGLDSARAAVAAQPDDPALKLPLAEALAASGAYEEALETCLGLVENHRKAFGEPARLVMLNIFQILPPDSELANEYRRRLSAALY
ncbi:MAG: tetratricopeptide repeat protein [Isosphaeraceae bacterium]